MLTAVTSAGPGDYVIDTSDATDQPSVCEALAARVGLPGTPVDVPPKAGLPTEDGVVGLRFGAKVGIGVPARPVSIPTGYCLAVVSGPAAGAVFELPAGSQVVGRAGDIVLADTSLSRRHANLTLSPDGKISVEDLGSVNGTFVEGVRVRDGAVPVRLGDAIGLGETVAEVRRIGPDPAVIERGEPGWINFVRPPRITPSVETPVVEFPSEPPKQNRRAFSIIMFIVPMLFGGVMALVMHSPRYLLFMLMSPIMMIGNMIADRRSGRKQARDDAASYGGRLEMAEEALSDALTKEKTRRRDASPDAVAAYLAAVVPGRRLWERRPGDPDFLTLRVGTGKLAAAVKVDAHVAPEVNDVPVDLSLIRHRVVGLAGPGEAPDRLLAWLVVQLATWHAPRDLQMSYLSARMDEDWAWLGWLPQMREDESADAPLARVACDTAAVASTVAWLQAVVESRKQAVKEHLPVLPHVVVIRGYRNLRLVPGLSQLLQEGPSAGVFVICSDEQELSLPEECQAVLTLPDPQSAVGRLARQGEPPLDQLVSDQVGATWCEQVARELAPLHDIGTEEHGSAIPNESRLLAVLDMDNVTGRSVADVWLAGGRSTKATIGELADGLFTIDVRSDGPHGLIAGTTGSGKSELLQTLIASLSIANRPDEMNFVLIDYKGGAAFKDCARLPHTVGTVTDLDGHLTSRALDSLAAELRRREHQLATLGAKDIEDYLIAKTERDAPMPRLVIIIDEFAALVQELPDFVTGLVDIARRGRSLGVHLILATQRPAGVVSNDIRSNTNLRIALRVTDTGDSSDVIDSPQAAHISKTTPGRAFARLGHSSLIPFQSSRVGGRPAGSTARAVSVTRVSADDLLKVLPKADVVEDSTVPTDLARLVDACRDAAGLTGIATPPSPWLDALPEQIDLDGLFAQFPQADDMVKRLAIPFGITDLPAQQARGLAALDLQTGNNLAIIGAGQSGRSTTLRAIAAAIGRHISPDDVQVYAIDAGGNALLPLVKLPHVGAVVTRDEAERVGRLIRMLRGIIGERQQLLADQGFANLAEQRAAAGPEQRLPYILFLIDAYEVLVQMYQSVEYDWMLDSVGQILQQGSSVGLVSVVTGDRSLLTTRVSNLFPNKAVLRLTDRSDYLSVGMPTKSVPDSMPPGRCFWSPGLIETQVSLISLDTSGAAQVAGLQSISDDASRRWGSGSASRHLRRVDALPSRFNLSQVGRLPRADPAPSVLPVAVAGDQLSLFGLDTVTHGPAFLVAGPRMTGRSTTLKTMATFALAKGWKVVVFTTRPSPLATMEPNGHLLGCFTNAADQKDDALAILEMLRSATQPSLVIADDIDRMASDDWLAQALDEHIRAIRDTGSALAASGTTGDLASNRGLIGTLTRARSGVLLAPQAMTDSGMFDAKISRSAASQSYPVGGGFLIRAGQALQAQVVFPDVAAAAIG